uniref:Capsid protein n=1 Tax=Plant associated genomovirus 5 TaxID=2584399 RepID=A0A4Y5QD38_9VIRU|nr:capsid protein [Plant associated genomovirus 5]
MAYRRPTYRKTRPYTRRYASRKTYSVRRSRPVYRRPIRKRRLMSTRRILNASSTKKRDTMVSYSNVVSPRNNENQTYAVSPAFLQAYTGTTRNIFIFPWVATARTSTNTKEVTDRNDQTSYMRGLKERIEIQTNSGVPWQWRRICFTRKGGTLPSTSTFKPYEFTSQGYVRVVNELPQTGTTFLNDLFDGGQLIDWNDFFNAKLNRDLVSVKYDKTVSIQSGNASGVLRRYTRWHPMNHNLTYGDEETASTFNGSVYSTLGRRGMGDYYVVDIFVSGGGAGTTDILSFNPQATLYWHEK